MLGIQRYQEVIRRLWWVLISILLLGAGFLGYHLGEEVDPHTLVVRIVNAKNFESEQKAYESLIEQVGPEEAQELLYRSGLPFDGATHLLNHTVGIYLYRHEGLSGITTCKEYFLASCYHGFILEVVSQEGIGVVGNIAEVCSAANDAVFAQCAHAIGHGLLVLSGYKNLPPALHTCDEIPVLGERRFNCYDGVFMENVWGVHDGAPSPDRWVKPTDVQYPCDASSIQEVYRGACWGNQPALLFQVFRGDIKRVANVCDALTNGIYRHVCFDGLARQIHPLVGENATKARDLCDLLPSSEVDACLISVARAAYSVGDRVLPMQICALVVSESARLRCQEELKR